MHEDVQKHFDEILTPYYKRLAASRALVFGEKEVVDHRGDLVKVRGTLYKGNLTGAANYKDKAGNQWTAWFNNDLKHGICIVKHIDQTIQVSASFNGQYHGFESFWTKSGT